MFLLIKRPALTVVSNLYDEGEYATFFWFTEILWRFDFGLADRKEMKPTEVNNHLSFKEVPF